MGPGGCAGGLMVSMSPHALKPDQNRLDTGPVLRSAPMLGGTYNY